ncbi:MAG: dUTP diphosphatase [Propionibacteriaceae bacterium]|jgi:dUTP pyrophosphatase|nr:dUTP diphosphatase [Propionibacteriaceae bacterium]
MEELRVLVTRLDPAAPLPRYAHDTDAGADLATMADLVLAPGERVVVGTGIAVAIPPGHAGFVYPRSGLAARSGLTMVNSPGVIDAGYRGEVRVCLLNTDRAVPIRLQRGDLVAQMVIQRVERVQFEAVAVLPGSERGTGGYGSSGGVAAWKCTMGELVPEEEA